MIDSNAVTIEILSRAGSVYGDLPNCTAFSWRYKLNGAGKFTAVFPHTTTQLSAVTIKGVLLKFYVGGEYVFTGVVESWRISTASNGRRMMLISGRDMLAELAEAPIGLLDLSSSSAGVTDGPADILTAANAFNGTTWALDTVDGGFATTATAVYAKFAGESALKALVMIAEHIGEHFRVKPNGSRELSWMRAVTQGARYRAEQTGGPTLHDEALVCVIESITENRDGYKLINRIYPYGGGTGETRLDLSACTRSAPTGYALSVAANYIESTDSITAMGKKIGVFREFKDIRPISNSDTDLESAANFLFDAALEYLQRMDDADDVRTYDVSVHGLSYDLKVGEEIKIVYEDDTYAINEDFVVLEIQRSVTADGKQPTQLTLSPNNRAAHTEAEEIATSMERGEVFSAHPQLNGNTYTTSYRVYVGEDQSTEKAEIRFWFGDEVAQLQQVLCRFNLSPIVAPSNTALSITNHSHTLDVTTTVGAPGGYAAYIDGTDGLKVQTGASGTEDWGSTGLTATPITTTFGIYRESGANTFAVSDLEYQVNGGGWSDLSGATSLGSDWYELDLTADLWDGTTHRPDQALNLLEVRRKSTGSTGKSGMIDALLSVRNIVQSVAYL